MTAPHFWGACPWCGSHEERDEDEPPSLTLCGNCVNWVHRRQDGSVLRPTLEELIDLERHPHTRAAFRQAHLMRRAREYRLH